MAELQGWLNIDKEKGITSHDLVYKVRRALKMKRVGHAGTLDPMATGVMVIAVGKATRLIQFLQEKKVYKAEVHLGISTNTLDADGQVTAEKPVDISKEKLLEIINRYTGKIKQIPPMASAVHHNGVRLYELARQGLEVERKAREVEIYSIKLLSFELPKFEIEVFCQSGTYIRTLADDIGNEIGCGAHLSGLQRTIANASFKISNSLKIENLTPENLLALDYPLQHLPEVRLNTDESVRYLHGQQLNNVPDHSGFCRIYNDRGELCGIGLSEKNLLIPKVNIV
jgi:tRNA pseudouridine55 synthase